MKKIVLLLTIGILAIVGVSCEKETELTFENLEGRWECLIWDQIYDFKNENELEIIITSTGEIVPASYTIIEGEKIMIEFEEDRLLLLEVVYISNKKLILTGYPTSMDAVDETGVEFKKKKF